MRSISLFLSGACLAFTSAMGEAVERELVPGEEASAIANAGSLGDRVLSILSGSVFGGFNKQEKAASTCTYQPNDFQSVAVADLFGVPELLTTEELNLLEEAFVKTYNKLAKGLCDSEFRKIKAVTINGDELEQVSGRLRGLASGNNMDKPSRYPRRRFSLKVLILGNCRRCEKDAELFDDAFRRLQTVYKSESLTTQGVVQVNSAGVDYAGRVIDNRPIDLPEKVKKYLWSGPYNCDCETTGELPSRAPGIDDFNSAYGRSLQRLSEDGLINNVKNLVGVSQLSGVPCDDLDDQFKSEIIVEANGDPDMITTSELESMKDLFLRSYKVSTENVCDPLFRVLTGAEVTIERDRRKLSDIPGLADLENYAASLDTGSGGRFRPFRFKFRVSGKCKGCKSEDRLFDDAFRRSLKLGSSNFPYISMTSRELGYIFNKNECYCVINAPKRTPFADEFQVVLSQNVEDEVQSEALPNILSTGTVIQVDNSILSTSPSSAPTTQVPSHLPTENPTTSPTTYPTESPSIAESSMPSTPSPSERPSSSPSRPTVPTESPVPSPSPSQMPTNR